MEITFEHDKNPAQIELNLRVMIFRAVRELLLNIVNHANATKAEISVNRRGDKVVACVNDNGKGISAGAMDNSEYGSAGFGLFSIKERLSQLNGTLAVNSRTEQGTMVVMEIPIHGDHIDENQDIIG